MNKKSFYDFKNQFTYNYIDNVKIPYNVLLTEFKSDATTYDDILKYLTPEISSDGTNITCIMKEYENTSYIQPTQTLFDFTINQNLNYVKTYNQFSNIQPYCISVNLSPDNTSIIINNPFTETEIIDSKLLKTNSAPVITFQYSSYNEYMIIPKNNLDDGIIDFITDIYKFEDDSTKTENSFNYDINCFTPSTLISMNKNLKYNVTFDSSLLGVRNTNQFQYKTNQKYWPNYTNIDSTVIDSYYEYESEYKLNGQILIDKNITEYYGNINLKLDSTVLIENEEYTINRAHVPPMRYLEICDFDINNYDNKYQPIISFNTINNFRHCKIKHDNHSQFSETNGINAMINNVSNKTNSEFLIEFSGYSEIVEL